MSDVPQGVFDGPGLLRAFAPHSLEADIAAAVELSRRFGEADIDLVRRVLAAVEEEIELNRCDLCEHEL